MNVIKQWFQRYLSLTESVYLFVLLLSLLLIIKYMGGMLAPVIVAVVLAYLLEGSVTRLMNWKFPRALAVSCVMIIFIGLTLVILLWVLPILGRQLNNLFNEVPHIIGQGQSLLKHLPEKYPNYITTVQLQHYVEIFKLKLADLGQVALSYSLASLPGFVSIIVYLILVPLLVLFFLLERPIIRTWIQRFIPKERTHLSQIWREINTNIASYVRGRVFEIIVVGAVSSITFWIIGLRYASLMGTLVGISVIIPYLGAIVVTIPILIIGMWQWGMSTHLLTLIIAYTIIIALDGNVLVPLLFSETMNLSAVAIIVSIIVFGGIWGLWGIFFAIPLATVIKALITLWPKNNTHLNS